MSRYGSEGNFVSVTASERERARDGGAPTQEALLGFAGQPKELPEFLAIETDH